MEFLYQIILDTILAIAIAVSLGFLHEALHIRKAKQLGFKAEKVKGHNITLVDVEDPVKARQIGLAPYYVIVPSATVILLAGIYLFNLGLIVGGGATLLIHAFAYKKDVE